MMNSRQYFKMASHTATYSFLCPVIILIATSIDRAVAVYCQGYTDHYNGNYITGFHCPGLYDDYEEYKCCGPSDSQYCCNLEDYNNYYGIFYWSVGKIIGVVLGALFGCVIFIVVIAAIVRCYIRNLRKQQQQTTTVSGSQPMSARTTTQRQDYPQQRQAYPQHGHAYQPQGQTYPPTGYDQPQDYPQEQKPTHAYVPQGQAQPPPTYTQCYSQQGLGSNPPLPAYYSHHQPMAANTYAPEVAPPPPSGN